MIVVIDYGVGNLGSILNMLRKIGAQAIISSNCENIARAEKLILPGVGSFDNGMSRLNESALMPILNHKVLDERTPILGICLGMQLFTKKSEEGVLEGLGWIDGETRRFSFEQGKTGLKIPHMGWNSIVIKERGGLCRGFTETPRFYFAHSYHVVCNNPDESIASTCYGYEFTSILRKGNILGTQFHPEKSHKFGIRILTNFLESV